MSDDPWTTVRRLKTAGFTQQQAGALADLIAETSRKTVKRAALIALAMWLGFAVIVITVVYRLQ